MKVFENFETKAIEHFCAQMLMAMTPEMFKLIGGLTPEMVESISGKKEAVRSINEAFVQDFMPEHPIPDAWSPYFGENPSERKLKDPVPLLVGEIRTMMRRLGRRWPQLNQQFLVMREYLNKQFMKQEFVNNAIIQLANMLSILIKKPDWLYHYAPHLALNERLNTHLSEIFQMDRLNVKVKNTYKNNNHSYL